MNFKTTGFSEFLTVVSKSFSFKFFNIYKTSLFQTIFLFYPKRSVLFPNVLNREINAENPFEKLVTDITYIRVGDDFVYLSAVLDLYNNEIVAWELSERNDLKLVLDTLKHLEGKSFAKIALIHSDQGFQYTTKAYEKQVKEELKIVGSHSIRGNCHDNACIECFFSHLKTEKIYLVPQK